MASPFRGRIEWCALRLLSSTPLPRCDDITADDLVGVDAAIHLASAENVPQSFGKSQFYASNPSMTIRLLEAAHKAGVPRVLIGTTCEVYGDQGDGPLAASLHAIPRSPYAASKAAMEMAARVYQLAQTQRGATTIVRIFNIYGQGGRADALIPSFALSALRYGRLPIEGDGHQRRDYSAPAASGHYPQREPASADSLAR